MESKKTLFFKGLENSKRPETWRKAVRRIATSGIAFRIRTRQVLGSTLATKVHLHEPGRESVHVLNGRGRLGTCLAGRPMMARRGRSRPPPPLVGIPCRAARAPSKPVLRPGPRRRMNGRARTRRTLVIDNPHQVEHLLDKMKASLPLTAAVTPAVAALIQERSWQSSRPMNVG
jgi:hypothetical protein